MVKKIYYSSNRSDANVMAGNATGSLSAPVYVVPTDLPKIYVINSDN